MVGELAFGLERSVDDARAGLGSDPLADFEILDELEGFESVVLVSTSFEKPEAAFATEGLAFFFVDVDDRGLERVAPSVLEASSLGREVEVEAEVVVSPFATSVDFVKVDGDVSAESDVLPAVFRESCLEAVENAFSTVVMSCRVLRCFILPMLPDSNINAPVFLNSCVLCIAVWIPVSGTV